MTLVSGNLVLVCPSNLSWAAIKTNGKRASSVPDYLGRDSEHKQRQSPLMRSGILGQIYLVVKVEIRQELPSQQPALAPQDVSSSLTIINEYYNCWKQEDNWSYTWHPGLGKKLSLTLAQESFTSRSWVPLAQECTRNHIENHKSVKAVTQMVHFWTTYPSIVQKLERFLVKLKIAINWRSSTWRRSWRNVSSRALSYNYRISVSKGQFVSVWFSIAEASSLQKILAIPGQ